MTRTIDAITLAIAASPDVVFRAASEVERWPVLLPHYRWVRMLEGSSSEGRGIVEMAAWRPFGPLKWPTWWVSEMKILPEVREVHYRHIRGITRGMEVVWRVRETREGCSVELIHDWDGPPWSFLRRPAAHWVIGPVFVHGIASLTLAGIQRHAGVTHG